MTLRELVLSVDPEQYHDSALYQELRKMPNGERGNFASRKCIFPKGIPTMVIQKSQFYQLISEVFAYQHYHVATLG